MYYTRREAYSDCRLRLNRPTVRDQQNLNVRRERTEDPVPPFAAPNGVAVGLMLVVDVLFVVAWIRAPDSWSPLMWFVLALYAAGLTFAVAWIRPRSVVPVHAFGLVLLPMYVQILVYLVFWAGAAGRWAGGTGSVEPMASPLDVFAGMCFFGGVAFGLVAAGYSRRALPLVLVELTPFWLLLVAAVLHRWT